MRARLVSLVVYLQEVMGFVVRLLPRALSQRPHGIE